jgi:hypothetical protein
VVNRSAAIHYAVLVTTLGSAGCNAILGIDEHGLAPPADAAAEAGTGAPDVRVDVDSGSPTLPDGSPDATRGDVSAAPDRQDLDVRDTGGSDASDAFDAGVGAPDARDGGNSGTDARDSGSIGDSGSTTGDGGVIGGDGGDAGIRIVVLRGTISTVQLAPAPAGNVRLVEHGIAVPWKSCNASNCVSGGIAP